MHNYSRVQSTKMILFFPFQTLDLPVGKNANSNRTANTTTMSTPAVAVPSTVESKLGDSGHSPSLDDRNGVGYRLHRGHVPVTSSKSASPPSTKTKSLRYGVTSHESRSVKDGSVVTSQPSMTVTNESDKDYSYVKFPRRSELPHDYSYPLLPEGYRRPSGAVGGYEPPSWPPHKPPAAETPVKKGDSSSSSSSSKKSSRRSLPSLVLSCAGGR